MDAAINQVINDLSEQYGYTYSEASHLLYYGGLKVYLAQDEAKQEVLDRIYDCSAILDGGVSPQ